MNTTLQAIVDRYRVKLDGRLPIELNASRNDLPNLCRELGMTKGAEVGVWKGSYSRAFCEAITNVEWTCVDPWAPYAAYRDNKNEQEKIEHAFAKAKAVLQPYNVRFLRMHSEDAAPLVPDRYLDVAYLDGNHEAAYVRQDLEMWAQKVRPHGLLAGHDYRIRTDKPFIQVKKTVDRYVQEKAIAPWFIFTGDRTPSFLWVVQ